MRKNKEVERVDKIPLFFYCKLNVAESLYKNFELERVFYSAFIHVNEEAKYVKLWKGFFDSIAIKERESYERQRQHLPLHYRKYVTEFQTDMMS